MGYLDQLSDKDREALEREALSVCQNQNCNHPRCPEDQEVDLWEGDIYDGRTLIKSLDPLLG